MQSTLCRRSEFGEEAGDDDPIENFPDEFVEALGNVSSDAEDEYVL